MQKPTTAWLPCLILLVAGLSLTGCSSMTFSYDSRLCTQEQIDTYLLKARKVQETNPQAARELYIKACECQGRKDCDKTVQ